MIHEKHTVNRNPETENNKTDAPTVTNVTYNHVSWVSQWLSNYKKSMNKLKNKITFVERDLILNFLLDIYITYSNFISTRMNIANCAWGDGEWRGEKCRNS